MKVLIAEDMNELRNIFVANLIAEGHDVVEAFDGADAIEKFDDSFEAVITDLDMPRKNGIELIDHIRENSNVPVFVCTGNIEKSVYERVIESKAEFYSKYDFNDIVDKLGK